MRFRVVLTCLTAVAALTACGASEYTYITNSEDRAYARVPSGWGPVDESSLASAIGLDPSVPAEEQGIWIQAFDSAEEPSSSHVFGPSTADPAVVMIVQDIPAPTRGQYSLDRLRDLFQPVSAAARQQLAANPMMAQTLTGFGLMRDEVLTPGEGVRGVHVTYRYRIAGGPFQVFDQVAYLNDDASKLYVLLARCSMTCYEEQRAEIDRVVSSFTVLEGS
jgi:hypothetical protein